MSDIVKFLSGKDDKKGNVTLDRGQVLFGITQIGPNTYRGSIYLDYFDPTANQIYRVNMSGSGGLYASGLKIKDKNNNSGSETTVAEVNGTATIPLPNYIGEKYFYSDEILSLTHKDASGNQLAKNLAAGTSYFHGGGILMINPNTINQEALIRILGSSGTVENTLELATRDLYTTSNDKAQIVARQYDKNNAILREAILLGTNGNTSFPGTVSAAGLTTTGNASIGGALNVTGNVTSPKFIGDLQGNADTATDATNSLNDGDGKKISTTYLKLAGGIMTGDINFAATTFNTNPTDSKGIVWSGGSDGAKIFYRQTANDAGSLVLQVSDDGEEYIQFRHTKNGVIYLKPNTKEFYPDTTNTGSLGTSSYRWGKVLIGTADSYGSDTKGIYWKNGVPTAMTYSLSANVQTGAAGALSYYSTTTQIDAFPNTVGSGTKIWYLATGVPTASTSTVGGTAQPVYLSSGTITALTADKGSATQGVYLAKGVITPMTYSLNATLNSGTANRLAYYSGTNAVSSGTNLYTNGSVLGVNTTSGSATPYGGTATNYAFNVSGNSYFFGTIEGSDTIKVNRNNAGGGLIIANSNAQYARMYVNTVGGAGNGSAAGATGVAMLELGNSTATSSASGSGKNNAQGFIRLYGTSTGYGQLYFDNTYFRPDHDIYFTNNSSVISGWANGIRGLVGTNDYWRVGGGATDSNAGYMEIATADEATEPIYVRQYSGAFATLNTTLTLLDASHNTIIPNALTVGTATSQGDSYKFYVNGTGYIQAAASNSTTRGLTINNGVLDIVNYGYILSIGNQNGAWTHFETTCSQFYFNKQIVVDGNLFPYTDNTRSLGDTTNGWKNIYLSKTGNIYCIGSKATTSMIRFIDNTDDAYGNGISIGGGGATIIGAGESAESMTVSSGGNEILYLLSDGTVNIEANANTIANRVGIQITTSGHVVPILAEASNNNSQYLGVNNNYWNKTYSQWIHANPAGSSTDGGITLYGNGDTNYGIFFRGTGNMGTHGYVTGDWATYFTMSNTAGRGWIFRNTGAGNVASIDYVGNAAFSQYIQFSNGAHVATNRSTDYHHGYSFNIGDNSKNIGIYSGSAGECGAVIVSPDGCLIYNSSDSGYNLDIHDKDLGTDLASSDTRTFCITQDSYYAWSRGGFQKNGSSDSYVLLGGGGHAAISSLSVAYATHAKYLDSYGNVAPESGRTSSRGGVYTYNMYNETANGAPSTYLSVIGFGCGTGGHVEIAGYWCSNNGLWYRSLRDTTDNWYAWNRIWVAGNSVTSAVWNDYAECRKSDSQEPGYVMFEKGDDSLSKTIERLQHFAGIVSDTWGFSQGETEEAKTNIAVAGRVLAYPYRDRNEYKPGDCVCAAPGGKVDIMTREEVAQYPDRIVGTVSCVPDYEEWGGGESADRDPVKVNGRIWIKVK